MVLVVLWSNSGRALSAPLSANDERQAVADW